MELTHYQAKRRRGNPQTSRASVIDETERALEAFVKLEDILREFGEHIEAADDEAEGLARQIGPAMADLLYGIVNALRVAEAMRTAPKATILRLEDDPEYGTSLDDMIEQLEA